MADIAKIILRIQQLRALGKSTHSRAEAESTMAIAAKLIAEHQISEAQLESEGNKSDDEMFLDQDSDFNVVYECGRSVPWKADLAWGLAKLNGVYMLQFSGIRNATSHRQGKRYRAFGRKSDIEITKYMFEYMSTVISELVQDYFGKGSKRGVNPERESWCLGCVRGFLAKMNAEKESVLRSSASTAMVLVSNRTQEAKTALQSANPKMRVRTIAASQAQRSADHYNSGFRKGQTLSVNKGLGN